VKAFVALYTGLPFTLADDEYLPQSAVELLKAKVTLTEDQVEFLDTHSIDISELEIIEPSPVTGEGTSSEGHEESTERIIKGNTTFTEVLNWGVSEEEIEAIIGEELPATGISIRGFATQKGLEFSKIKESLSKIITSL